MGLFSCTSCRSLEKQLEMARASAVDQHEAMLRQQEAFERERSMLLDKILAVTSPAAVRELGRPSYNSQPRERRPLPEPVRTPFSTPPAPRPEGRQPHPGRLRPRAVMEGDRPAQTTPEAAAAEIAGETG